MPRSNNLRTLLRPTRGGAIVVGGLVIFGALILGGLYLSPKAYPPPAPNVPLGAPEMKLRFVSYDLGRQHPMKDPQFAAIVKLEPDYVLLQNVNEDDAIEIAELLNMKAMTSYHPQLYQRSEHLAGPKGEWGNLTLSRQPMYLGAPLGGERGGFGGWAESVVDGHGFFVANVHLAPKSADAAEAADLERIWKSRGSPPMVLGVLPTDATPPKGLGFLSAVAGTTGEFFYVSKEWKVLATGTAPASGSGLVPTWIDVTRASAGATQP